MLSSKMTSSCATITRATSSLRRPAPPGLQIHAIDLDDPDQIRELTQRLHAQGYHHVEHLYPIPLYSTDSGIITLNPVS
jgi:hypothetical protein